MLSYGNYDLSYHALRIINKAPIPCSNSELHQNLKVAKIVERINHLHSPYLIKALNNNDMTLILEY
ncbi:hypothetical protein BpHYR1_013180 [Brachionus plicatilis]|uniref:Uncharacterized protein n=1 Tax=Brachionus plicatilis TaxID=10195 RepID=A0A3M7T451_BRAPC|nr:hypothetical protein BpHYR1_013180 [Brachionus plicatilis]